jgi:hypothetical protein
MPQDVSAQEGRESGIVGGRCRNLRFYEIGINESVVGKAQESFLDIATCRSANSVACDGISQISEVNPEFPAIGGHEDGAVSARIDQE